MRAETVRLSVALADAAGRRAAAQRLAEYAGADALHILVMDEAVRAYVPVPGFATLPGGSGWRDLLRRAVQPGLHRGVVHFPCPSTSVDALACASDGIVLVFLGGAPDAAATGELADVMPLLASTFRAEQRMLAAEGEQRVAVNHARESEALARALDAARAELEGALRALEDRSEALEQARERAEAASRAKDEFMAVLGHELRNPLAPIVTAIQLLRLKGRTGREHEIIERQVSNMMRLVDDLLDVSRLTTGKVVLRREQVDVADVAARAIEMVSPMLERKRQMLSAVIPPGLTVDADPIRLAQVLSNLLANAAKYSDEDSRIVLDAEGRDDRVRIRVKDDGIGIAPHMLEQVFHLFEQQRQAIDRSQGGLGLGLAIVRSLVALHGGSVRAHSAGEGHGAEFVVELPRVAADARPAPGETAQRVGDDFSPGRRVLLVDDNDDAAMMLAGALRAVGHAVHTAHDGPAGLAAAAQVHPDVAVLDIGLPVMDGYELAQRLRAIPGLGSVKLIALTGYGQEADRRRAGLAGFDAHLVKPVSLDQLRRVIADVCPRE